MGSIGGLGACGPRRRRRRLRVFLTRTRARRPRATYSDQQRKDAKKHICETFKIVDRAVVRNSHLKNPDNGGPIGALSVATAQRFAFYDGGAFPA